MISRRLVLFGLVAASSDVDEIKTKTKLGEALKEHMEGEEQKLDEKMKAEDQKLDAWEKKVEERKEDLEHHGFGRPSSWLQTGEATNLTKPTSLLEADARVAAGMDELDKVLSFDELDHMQKPSSLIEVPGLAQQRERFEAARAKLHMVKDSIREDSRRVQQNAKRAAAALLEEPSSLLQTQRLKQTQTALSRASMGTQQWAAQIAAKQNNFIQKLANHGVKIPQRLRDAMAADKAMSLVQTKPSIIDQIPVTHMTPRMVDDRMKAVEHRLRHDAQIFQEEADSGKRPILPESFLQTSEAGPDDDDAESPMRKSFDEMQAFRKEMRKDKAELERDDEEFVEGNKRAKAQLAEFERENPEKRLLSSLPSSFLETGPEEMQKVDEDLKDLATQIHGEAAEWRSQARHAHRAEAEEQKSYEESVRRFKQGLHHPASFLQTGARADMDSDAVGQASLGAWKTHMEANARARAASHAGLEKELAFRAAEFGPELLAQHDRGVSLLQTAEDPDPALLRAQLQQIEERAKDHRADMTGDDADLAPPSALVQEPQGDEFRGVMTPGVHPEEPEADSKAPEDPAAPEAAAEADEQAVKAADSAEKEEQKAAEADDKKADQKAEKEDDQLRKQQ